MEEHDIEGDYRGLEDLYFQRLFEIIENLPTEKGSVFDFSLMKIV